MPFPCPFPPQIRTVGIFAPSGVPDPQRLERGLARLRDWGLRIVHPGRDDPRERFLAGSDALRLRRLHELLANPEVDLLLAARGGYGCARLLDGIDWGLLLARDLPVVGYSDLTALHAAAFARGHRRSVFGPMVAGDFGRRPRRRPRRAFPLGRLRLPAPGPGRSPPRPGTTSPACGRARPPARCCPRTSPSWASASSAPPTSPTWPAPSSSSRTSTRPPTASTAASTSSSSRARWPGSRGLVFGQFSETEDAEWLPDVLADFAARVPGPVAAGLGFGHAFPSCSLPVGPPFSLAAAEGAAVLRSAWTSHDGADA